jgi:hypothetical protein
LPVTRALAAVSVYEIGHALHPRLAWLLAFS